MSWSAGNASCSALGTTLATIYDDDDAERLKNMADDEQHSVNIGLHDLNTEGVWEWTSGHSCGGNCSDLKYWNSGEPNDYENGEDCGIVYPNRANITLLLNDAVCGSSYYSACDWNVEPIATVIITNSGFYDCNGADRNGSIRVYRAQSLWIGQSVWSNYTSTGDLIHTEDITATLGLEVVDCNFSGNSVGNAVVYMALSVDLMGGSIECSSSTIYQDRFRSNYFTSNTVGYLLYAYQSNIYVDANGSNATATGNDCGTYCVHLIDSASYIDADFIASDPYVAFEADYRFLFIELTEETSSTVSNVTNTTMAPTGQPTPYTECCLCTEASNDAGCPADTGCEDRVCAQFMRDSCCDTQWSEVCADQASDYCGTTTSQPTSDPTAPVLACLSMLHVASLLCDVFNISNMSPLPTCNRLRNRRQFRRLQSLKFVTFLTAPQ